MRMPFVPTEGCCRVCGKAVEDLDGEYLCEDCGGRDAPAFDRAAGAVRFEGRARELILGYKAARRLWLRDDFVDWLEAAARARLDVSAVDLVMPMPTTVVHRFLRGYNQCEYLASELARRIRRLCRRDVISRCGSPMRQAELDEASRRENVKGTFFIRRPEFVRGRTVLVVDDVMTTGSTLSECAHTLKSAGAWRVWCATVAQAVR